MHDIGHSIASLCVKVFAKNHILLRKIIFFNKMNQLIVYITDIGDSAVLTVITLLSMIAFALQKERENALRLGAAFFGSSCLIGVLKILVIGCGHPLTVWLNLRSPSGHAALSSALFGGLALIVRRSLPRVQAFAAITVSLLLIASIAVSRVILGFHSVSEIIVGVAVGGLCAVLACAGASAPQWRALRWLPFALLVPLLLLHGVRLPVEGVIEAVSSRLHSHAAMCAE
jgi:membrane-associated phospholipid phosphatase